MKGAVTMDFVQVLLDWADAHEGNFFESYVRFLAEIITFIASL